MRSPFIYNSYQDPVPHHNHQHIMSILQNIKDLTLGSRSADHATADLDAIEKIEVGKEAAKHFLFQDGYRNLNHGPFLHTVKA